MRLFNAGSLNIIKIKKIEEIMAKIPPEMSFNWEFIEQNELNWFSIFQLIPSIQKFKALNDFFQSY